MNNEQAINNNIGLTRHNKNISKNARKYQRDKCECSACRKRVFNAHMETVHNQKIPTTVINANIQLVNVIIYDLIRMFSVVNQKITSVLPTIIRLPKNVILIRMKEQYMKTSKTTNLLGVIIPLPRKVIQDDIKGLFIARPNIIGVDELNNHLIKKLI